MITCTMCLNANAFGFVNVPCGTHCLGLAAYAMRCEDDALYTCQTATPTVSYLLSALLCAHVISMYLQDGTC